MQWAPPSAPLALLLPWGIAFLLPWLHPLRGWSLRQTRGDSVGVDFTSDGPALGLVPKATRGGNASSHPQLSATELDATECVRVDACYATDGTSTSQHPDSHVRRCEGVRSSRAISPLGQQHIPTPSRRTPGTFPGAFESLPPELPVAFPDPLVRSPDASFRLRKAAAQRLFFLLP